MSTWSHYRESTIFLSQLGFSLDYSRVKVPSTFFVDHASMTAQALRAMQDLEKGGIANPDENRMVGHYWLRTPELAPTSEISLQIVATRKHILEFSGRIHKGEIANAQNQKFRHLLVIGIGGSALGPQFVSQALRSPGDPLDLYFFDNTDPDGMDRIIASIPSLPHTLVVVISKSGGTKETRNGQLVVKEIFRRAGLFVQHHFVAVTGEGSELDKTAIAERWLERFPMWDWVGGRTSECSAVGLLPAALQGFPIEELLSGAAAMDAATRNVDVKQNPALVLALLWFHIGKGKGEKDMVILPYKDRIELLSRYLQQLVMESLGKELDCTGAVVNQGLAVYGNKGATDQHAYVQQLRDGISNFFVVFIHALKDSLQGSIATELEVEPGVTSGDFLHGFYLGTRAALHEKGRESISVSIDQTDAFSIGMLIALFERAVGFYASFIRINAYHQPGVEAGKKAAGEIIQLQQKICSLLAAESAPLTVEAIAQKLSCVEKTESVFHIVRRLAANGRICLAEKGNSEFAGLYSKK